MTLTFLLIFIILMLFGVPVAVALGTGVIISMANNDFSL